MKKRGKSNKNILLLGTASLLNDLSSEMIMPILPLFISALGGAGLIIGIIGGIRDSLSSILKITFGYLSDKIGKKKVFVFWGYLTSSIFKLLLGLSKTLNTVLIFSGLERIGKGMRTAPRDSILAESSKEKRGKGFGIHRAMDTAGAILGSISALFLFWFFRLSFNTIILIAAIFSFMAIIPLFFVKEKKSQKSKLGFRASLKAIPKKAKKFIIISSIFALANFSYMFFILKAQESFNGRLAIAIPILLYIFFNIFYAAFAIPFGKLSDKVGRKKVIASGYLLFAITASSFIFFKSFPFLLILFILYGITYALVDSNQRAYISDLSNPKQKTTTLGAFHTTIGIIALPANILAGVLWQISPTLTFLYAGILSLIAFAALLFHQN